MNALQLNADGRLRHLLTLEGLPRALLLELLDRADALAAQLRSGARLRVLAGRTVVNLFFEPSTRTRCSFELAAERLGADVIHFDAGASSTSKGETLRDTVRTLEAMDCQLFVVRHAENGTPEFLARQLTSTAAVINAGDGNHAHPTQGLLDALTIRRHKPDFANLTVAIVGDVLHSRVARSDIHALTTLGVGELRICGPQALLPKDLGAPLRVTSDIDRALAGADAIIMLRLQKERMQQAMIPSEAEYFRDFGLTPERVARARPDVLVMHPGPMNRGVEIASEVADGPRSVVLEQVANGVPLRMAVMATLLNAAH